MTLVRHAFLCALLLAACSVAQGQTKEDWATFVEKNIPSPKEQGKPKAYEILMVDTGEETAVVKVKSEYINIMFTDTLSFLRVDNEWKIYNKVFEAMS